jgi:glycosyltransferase involved in cell wall biosynthesis
MIGLPVYNGAKYLECALEALLAQDMPDFELVISDNASTDATPEICRAFAARDPRIRILRQPENIGAGKNFGALLAEARNPYFLFAAHDDRYAPSFLRKTLAALEANPSAVLAVSRIRFVDGEGHDHPRLKELANLHTLGLSRVERLRHLFVHMGWYAIYGLARPEHLRLVGIDRAVFGQDVVALMHLLLLGDIVRVDEPLFEYRVERPKNAADYRNQVGSGMAIERPYTNLFVGLLRVVFESDWSEEEKEQVLLATIITVARENRGWRRMIGKESIGRLDRWSNRLFAAHLCWVTSRALPGGTTWSQQMSRLARVQRAF